MPCYRYIVTDASLYREQTAPYQLYSRRWQTMDIIDIPTSDWASSEVRTIIVSPNHFEAPLEFRVREFIPVDGDLLEEQWVTPTGKQRVPVPRYAVADMHETAQMMKGYIERNVWKFIAETVGPLDQLLWETYTMAFRHIGLAKVTSPIVRHQCPTDTCSIDRGRARPTDQYIPLVGCLPPHQQPRTHLWRGQTRRHPHLLREQSSQWQGPYSCRHGRPV